jgi:predicted TIM-barrel fold metal-dependent hydrolase
MTDTLDAVDLTDPRATEPLIAISSDCHVSPQLVEDLFQYCPKDKHEAFHDWMKASEPMRAAGRKGFVFGGNEELPEVQRVHTWNLQTEGARDIHERIRDLDRDGVAGEIMFHGSAPFAPLPFVASGIGAKMESEDAALGMHMYNQWLADFCSVEPERHVGLAQLPMWDLEAAIAELRWCAEAGLKGVNFPAPRAELIGYENPHWDPFWAACQDHSFVLASHGGGGAATPPVSGPMGSYIYMAESNAFNRVSPVVRLVFGGVFERFPGLKVVQTEQQGAWYGDVLKELDSRWMGFRLQIGDYLTTPPSETLRAHYFVGASFQSRFEAQTAIDQGYVDNILWGSDYPHPEGTYHFPDDPNDPDEIPTTHLAMRNTYAGLPAEPIRKMLGENAVKVYGFDRDALVKVAARINAPTLEELSHPIDQRPDQWGFAFREGEWLT